MDPFTFTTPNTAGPSTISPMSAAKTQKALFEEFELYPFSDDPDFKVSGWNSCPQFMGLHCCLAGAYTGGITDCDRNYQGTEAHCSSDRRDDSPSSMVLLHQVSQRFPLITKSMLNDRLKGTSIPFEAYMEYSRHPPTQSSTSSPNLPGPSSCQGRPSRTGDSPLAEARRMMLPEPQGSVGEGGMTFAMLSRLIAEGKADQVPGIKQIPDQINVRGFIYVLTDSRKLKPDYAAFSTRFGNTKETLGGFSVCRSFELCESQ